jgi:hypothetical protein
VGVAQASSVVPLTNTDIRRPSRFSSNPTHVPVTSVSGTTTTANAQLLRRETQNSGSLRIVVKLASPTHWVGATPATCSIP